MKKINWDKFVYLLGRYPYVYFDGSLLYQEEPGEDEVEERERLGAHIVLNTVGAMGRGGVSITILASKNEEINVKNTVITVNATVHDGEYDPEKTKIYIELLDKIEVEYVVR